MNRCFAEILNQVRRGQPAQLQISVEEGVYTRRFLPRERLILLGGGHIAAALCEIGAALDFAVTVIDDRPAFVSPTRFPQAAEVLCDDYAAALEKLHLTGRDYVAILTRGHRFDAECLWAVQAGTEPKYVGMIGSRSRVAMLMRALEEEGFDRERLARIHAPIGLSINAQTPREIAVAIAAELIQCRREGLARRSHSLTMLNEDVDMALLSFLAEDTSPKAVVLVYDASGSTPAKSGAMMAVNLSGQVTGTIGGGCWEHQAARAAYWLVGTGQHRQMAVELNDVSAALEGMACGGQMRLYLWDVPQDGNEPVADGAKI
ncbi:MAG: XdhC family protein [Oscillospiraceae bacterium]|nr:XdhC family protein [Oscillospiraceae bacterium]